MTIIMTVVVVIIVAIIIGTVINEDMDAHGDQNLEGEEECPELPRTLAMHCLNTSILLGT